MVKCIVVFSTFRAAGVHAVPCYVVATAAYNALMRFDGHLVTTSDKYLTDINFVNIQQEITSCMIDTFQKLFQLSSPPPSMYDRLSVVS